MYLRTTQRRNKDGSVVRYLALAENRRHPDKGHVEARVIHSFGREDQLDRAALERLVRSIRRVLDGGAAVAAGEARLPEIEIDRVFDLGIVLAARTLWEQLGIGTAIRRCLGQAGLGAPHEAALFAMAAGRPRLQAGLRRTLAARCRLAARGVGPEGGPAVPGARRPGGVGAGD
jgi:hypothetical protein